MSVPTGRLVGRNGDEQLLRGRVYGHDHHDDPDPGLRRGRTYAELVGGPPDGLLLDIYGWRTEKVVDGVALPTELSGCGRRGRARRSRRSPVWRAVARKSCRLVSHPARTGLRFSMVSGGGRSGSRRA
ncbi:hypothetical protein [Streptomyces sp. c-19]|uniref:hypothetical protein n=1 Tax=Streptomyces sp. c-19 TaxID=2789275 RepID=UPI0039813D98